MKSSFLALFFSCFSLTAIAANNVTLTVDGENYSCQKSSVSVSCRCVEDRSEIDFRLNGKEIKVWYGNNTQNMVECAQYASLQPYCADTQPVSCTCAEDRSEIEFRLNGKKVKVWYGSSSDNMIECVKHLRSQSFCK